MENLKDVFVKKKEIFPVQKLKEIFKQLLCFVFSFFVSGIIFPGEIVPFAMSFVGGTGLNYVIASSLGSAVGCLVFCDTLTAFRLIAAITLICFIRLSVENRINSSGRVYFLTITTFLVSFLSSVVINLALSFSSEALLLDFCEALISGAGSCFIFRVFSLKFTGGRLCAPGAFDNISIMLMGATLLLALNQFSIAGFSFAHVLAGFAVMLYALFGRETSSALAGICCAVTLGFSETQPQFILSFPLCGLLCGIGSAYGKIPVAICFIVADTISVVLRGTPENAIFSVAETVLCALIFVFIPERFLFSLSERIMPLRGDPGEEETKKLFQFKIKKSAKAIMDVSESVIAVSKILSRVDNPDVSDIGKNVRSEICESCRKKDYCWKRTEKVTTENFKDIISCLTENKKITPEMLSQLLEASCCNEESLCDSFNRNLCEYEARMVALSEVRDAKELAASQFSSISAILKDTAESAMSAGECDIRTAVAVQNILEEEGFSCVGALAFREKNGRSAVEVFCSHVPVISDYSDILQRLFDVTGFVYCEPAADEYSDYGTVLSFCEQTKFSAAVAVSSRTSDGERFCGDSFDSFYDGKGNFYVILSDGMGTGGRAAIDSAMTCSLMSRLMKTGFSVDSALKAVNSALMVKSAAESLSTLDILKIDMETGKAQFYKAGAAMSIVKRGDKTAVVEKSSLPLGIMKNVSAENASITLSSGDYVIIMSDGASQLPPKYFKDLLYRGRKAELKQIADKIVKDASELTSSGRRDDITAVCVKLL